MRKILIVTISFITIFTLSACSGSSFKADMEWDVEPFHFTSQRGEEVTLDNLKGDVWLASFIFTNCETVCPPMTFNMTEVQEEIMKQGVEDYKIIAFSVDPETDTPEVLTDYLSMYNVPDESKWHLLTGYDQSFISQFARNSFKTAVVDDPQSNQVTHGTSFFLVNQEGKVVKQYSGFKDVPKEQIATDIKLLVEE
ncbi:SCO family protein [Paenisporosarcina cavernae]|uniref:SCO family protein n=1 Tax=Paenisporosarcina cavernae TaxID=2320858 RepID=A0A385YVG5_9BACL|nr:SCO family protein [Paenisporosarcina cavernae]AYC29493.1 SCO family protein [Paenisporosarcina cavernae]